MRNWILVITILIICSCKENSNAVYEEFDKATSNLKTNKTEYYKDKIHQEFISMIEASQLRSSDSINAIYKQDVPFEIEAHLKLESIEIGFIENPQLVPNPDYEFYYTLVQRYLDTINQKEVIKKSIVAIDEQQQVIDNETVNTVKIIW